MSKKNIGATLALYPCPVIVVGAMVNDKPTWTLVAHAGTVAHSHLMVSLVQAHYINQGIRENKKLSVNVVDESWLKDADRMGTISGNKVDKSEAFAWTMGENGAPLIDEAKVSIECEMDGNGFLQRRIFSIAFPFASSSRMWISLAGLPHKSTDNYKSSPLQILYKTKNILFKFSIRCYIILL